MYVTVSDTTDLTPDTVSEIPTPEIVHAAACLLRAEEPKKLFRLTPAGTFDISSLHSYRRNCYSYILCLSGKMGYSVKSLQCKPENSGRHRYKLIAGTLITVVFTKKSVMNESRKAL
jgi:hypothetical protein